MRAVKIPLPFLGSAGCQPAVAGSLPATFRRIREAVENSLAKLPRLTGWQPVLPRKSHARYSFRVAHARLACWFRRLAETVFRKVRDDETSSPARETRALPGITVRHV